VPRPPSCSLKLIIPAGVLFVLLCLVTPFAAGLALRSQLSGTLPGTGQPWIGIRMRALTPQAAQLLQLPSTEGALIDRVYPTSPADQAGLTVFDVIIQVDGQPVVTIDVISNAVRRLRPGDTLSLTVLRPAPTGPTRQTLSVVVGQWPRPGEVRGWTEFRNPAVPYQFRYPNTWFIDPEGAPAAPILLAPPTRYDDFVQFQVAANVPPLEEWYRQVLESARTNNASIEVRNERSVTLSGQSGRRAQLRLVNSQNQETLVELVLVRDATTNFGYFIFLSANPASFPALLANFEEMLASFRITR
jgi:hypothetical protein